MDMAALMMWGFGDMGTVRGKRWYCQRPRDSLWSQVGPLDLPGYFTGTRPPARLYPGTRLCLQYLSLVEIRPLSFFNVPFFEPAVSPLTVSGLGPEPCQWLLEAGPQTFCSLPSLCWHCTARRGVPFSLPGPPLTPWLASQVSSTQLSGRQQATEKVEDGFWSSPRFSPPWVYSWVLVSIYIFYLCHPLLPLLGAGRLVLKGGGAGPVPGLGSGISCQLELLPFWPSPSSHHWAPWGLQGVFSDISLFK